MGCLEENTERYRNRAHAFARGEIEHPVHKHMPLSANDGIATGKEMYRRFYGNQ